MNYLLDIFKTIFFGIDGNFHSSITFSEKERCLYFLLCDGTVQKVSDTTSHHWILTLNDATESIRHRR